MAGSDQRDPYKILQVDSEAEKEVIEAAYRKLARKYHPDLNKEPDATAKMQDINWAYEILKDSTKRTQYDLEKTLREARAKRTSNTRTNTNQPWQQYRRDNSSDEGQPGRTGPGPRPGSRYGSPRPGSPRYGGTRYGGPRPGGPRPGGSRTERESPFGSRTSSRSRSSSRPPRERPYSRYRPPDFDNIRDTWRNDERPFARAGRDQDAGADQEPATNSGYRRPYERYREPGTTRKDSASSRKRDAGRPSPGRPSYSRTGFGGSAPARATAAASRTATARRSAPTRRAPSFPSGRFSAEDLFAPESRPLLIVAGSVIMITVILILALSHFLGGDSSPEQTPVTSVQYGSMIVYGHWIHIWGNAYRDQIQAAVDTAMSENEAGEETPVVQLGGYVFADAVERPRGFYCPPNTVPDSDAEFPGISGEPGANSATDVAAAAPPPPVTLDDCLPITLTPGLSGYRD